MRRFHFVRSEDVSGVSGTGVVAEGIEFTDGSVAVRWLSHTSALTFFSNVKNFVTVHGHSGLGRVQWIDPDPEAEEDNESTRTNRSSESPA